MSYTISATTANKGKSHLMFKARSNGHNICYNILTTFVESRCWDRLTTPHNNVVTTFLLFLKCWEVVVAVWPGMVTTYNNKCCDRLIGPLVSVLQIVVFNRFRNCPLLPSCGTLTENEISVNSFSKRRPRRRRRDYVLSDHYSANNQLTAMNNFHLETVRNKTSILDILDIDKNWNLLLFKEAYNTIQYNTKPLFYNIKKRKPIVNTGLKASRELFLFK